MTLGDIAERHGFPFEAEFVVNVIKNRTLTTTFERYTSSTKVTLMSIDEDAWVITREVVRYRLVGGVWTECATPAPVPVKTECSCHITVLLQGGCSCGAVVRWSERKSCG